MINVVSAETKIMEALAINKKPLEEENRNETSIGTLWNARNGLIVGRGLKINILKIISL